MVRLTILALMAVCTYTLHDGGGREGEETTQFVGLHGQVEGETRKRVGEGGRNGGHGRDQNGTLA